jgi:hypothetical protein
MGEGKRSKGGNAFFEYLAYDGIKTQKSLKLEKQKQEQELAPCTFVPNAHTKSPKL